MADEVNYDYFERGYRRIWNNFAFSFKIYQSNVSYQRKLCLDSMEALNKLYMYYLETDGVLTRKLYNYYNQLIQKNYDRIR